MSARTDLREATSVAFGDMRSAAPAMLELFVRARRAAGTESTVLIEGESGTGKELLATEIARNGSRCSASLFVVDCGSLCPTLVESELFGHMRGAFTGADRDRAGVFEAAAGGTVFLDEIGELPLSIQPKLLRAVERHEIRRVGDARARKVDVRIIAATNRCLARDVRAGTFRADLYFRLSTLILRIPPLRERMQDLALLVGALLRDAGLTPDRTVTPAMLVEMAQYDWPGNVRELRNFLERWAVLGQADLPVGGGLLGELAEDRVAGTGTNGPLTVDVSVPFSAAKRRLIAEFERAYMSELLDWSGGNISRAARRARLDRMTIHRLVRVHGLRLHRAVAPSSSK